MTNLLMVATGGMLGCLARYGIGVVCIRWLGTTSFPYATFAVNLIGCFAIGLMAGRIGDNPAPAMQLFGMVGFLGGFTTFSAFGLQTVDLARNGQLGMAMINIAANNVLGLLAVAIGIWLASRRD